MKSEKTVQHIVRKGTFDSGHRVMNERMKCFNIHGHTYLYDLSFSFNSMQSIGYAIDFKEIKRVACQWIDDILDHGMILNPCDELLLKTTQDLNGKYWLMSLNGEKNYCNPSVENVAKEIFLAMDLLFASYPALTTHKITLYETPNCYTICKNKSISNLERKNFMAAKGSVIAEYAKEKGIIDYDDRNSNSSDTIDSSIHQMD